MSHFSHRVIASDGRVVNLPSFLPAVMTSSSSVGVKVNSCYLIYGESSCKQYYDDFGSSDDDDDDDDDDDCEDSAGNDVDDSYDGHDNVYDGCDDGDVDDSYDGHGCDDGDVDDSYDGHGCDDGDVDDSYDGHDNVYDGCDDGDDVEYQLYYFFLYLIISIKFKLRNNFHELSKSTSSSLLSPSS